MVDLLGFTACKLELALIPSIITTSGRMLTGDDDIDMEIFLFQMAIFVLPIVLGKMGYGFEVNPSTIFTCFTAVVVGIRFALRCREDPIFLELYCSDDAREALEEAGDGPDAVLMQAALCVLPAEQQVEQDWLCALRQCILGTVGDAPACSPSEEENPIAADVGGIQIALPPAGQKQDESPEEESSEEELCDPDDENEDESDEVSEAEACEANNSDSDRLKIMRTAFERYDLDDSSTINSREELEQLVLNLVFKLHLSTKKQKIDEILSKMPDPEKKPMNFEQFTQWFESAFC